MDCKCNDLSCKGKIFVNENDGDIGDGSLPYIVMHGVQLVFIDEETRDQLVRALNQLKFSEKGE